MGVEGGINFWDTAEVGPCALHAYNVPNWQSCSVPSLALHAHGQVYGYQGVKSGTQSEQILGRLAKASSSPVVVGTKFFTVPWTNFLIGGGFRCRRQMSCCLLEHVRAGIHIGAADGHCRLGRESIVKALRASLERLGMQKVDLYQVLLPCSITP